MGPPLFRYEETLQKDFVYYGFALIGLCYENVEHSILEKFIACHKFVVQSSWLDIEYKQLLEANRYPLS